MSALVDARIDALEDAVFEKATMSAPSDSKARKKIEGVFARFLPNGVVGTCLLKNTFKRAVEIYLNGVDPQDLELLAMRYRGREAERTPGLAAAPMMICVDAFLDNVFNVDIPRGGDERLHSFGHHDAEQFEKRYVEQHSKHQGQDNESNYRRSDKKDMRKKHHHHEGPTISVARRAQREDEEGAKVANQLKKYREKITKQQEMEKAKSNSWSYFEKAEEEGRDEVHANISSTRFESERRDDRSRSKRHSEKEAPPKKHIYEFMNDTQKGRSAANDLKVAKFILAFRHYLLRRAAQEQKKLPASRRLMAHPSVLGEKVARRLLARGFVEASQRSFGGDMFEYQSRDDAARMKRATVEGMSLSFDQFFALISCVNSEAGVEPLDQQNANSLWWKCDQGRFSRLSATIFPKEDMGGELNIFRESAEAEVRKVVARGPEMGPFDLHRSGERNITISHKHHTPSSLRYPQCCTTVSPPTKFDPALIAKSARVPEASLEIAHVFGFNGSLKSPNLWVGSDGCLVFAAAAAVVIHDPVSSSQRIFSGHDDDVSAVAVDDTGLLVASGQVGVRPCVLLWNISNLQILHRIGQGFFEEIIFSLAFSGDSSFLVSVGQTEKQSLGVWDVKSGELLADIPAPGGHKPSIHTIVCEPSLCQTGTQTNKHGDRRHSKKYDDGVSRFLTIGAGSHVMFYSFERNALHQNKIKKGVLNRVPLSRKVGELGKFDRAHVSKTANANYRPPRIAMNAAVYLSGGRNEGKSLVATAATDGKVYIWQNCECVFVFLADDWPITSMACSESALITGSSSSSIRFFDLSDNFKLVGTLCIDEAISRKVAEDMLLNEHSHLGGNNRSHMVKPIVAGQSMKFDEIKGKYSASHLVMYGNKNLFVGSNRGDLFKVNLGSKEVTRTRDNSLAAGVQRSSVEPLVISHWGSVTALAAHPVTPGLFYTVATDRKLIVWSTRKRSALSSHRLPHTPSAIAVSSPEVGVLAVGFANGSICIYSVKSMNEVAHKSESKAEILCVSFSPDGSFMAAGNKANVIELYSVDKGFRSHKRLRGHTSYIVSIDWSMNCACLMSVCASQEILYWDVSTGKQMADTDDVERDGQWSTWTSKLGFPVMGIWKRGQGFDDVNAVSRSKDLKFIAVATDDGEIRVLNYPCVVAAAPAKEMRVHCAHVSSVKFLSRFDEHGDHWLASSGGSDRSVMLWKLTPKHHGGS